MRRADARFLMSKSCPVRPSVSSWFTALATLALCLPAFGELPKRDFDELKKRAKSSLKSGNVTDAAAAVRELAADDSKRAVEVFVSFAKVPDHTLYTALRDGLAGMSSDGAKAEMLKVVGKGSSLEKLLVVDAAAKRSDAFVGDVLGAALAAKQSQIQRAAVMVIGQKKVKGAVGAMIDLLERLEKSDSDGLNANLIRKTLRELTQENFETAEDWGKFWLSAGGSNGDAPKAAPDGGDGKAATKRRKPPTFFGSEILSNRVVFVIDTSLSMDQAQLRRQDHKVYPEGAGPKREPAAPDSRLERAKAQLEKVVGELPKGAKFGIVAYSAPKPGQQKLERGKPIPPDFNGFPWLKVWRPKLMRASKKSVGSAAKFVEGLYADGLTYTLRAIEAALKIPDVDLIVLLSDGEPNDIDLETGQRLTIPKILEEVLELNRAKRCVINTLGILSGGTPRDKTLAKFLEDLAKQNGGSYTAVTKK